MERETGLCIRFNKKIDHEQSLKEAPYNGETKNETEKERLKREISELKQEIKAAESILVEERRGFVLKQVRFYFDTKTKDFLFHKYQHKKG